MVWQFTNYSIPLIAGFAILTLITLYAWQRRSLHTASWMVALSLALMIYVGGYTLELSSITRPAVLLSLQIEYLGLMAQNVCLLLVVASFVGESWLLRPRVIMLLLVIPAITMVLALTNDSHELIWENLRLVAYPHLSIVDFEPGTWYPFNVAYVFLLTAWSGALVIRSYRRETGLYRRQLQTILAGITFPLLAGLIYMSGILGLRIDPTPYAVVLTALVFTNAILNERFLDVVPVARETIVETMSDAVIVLDPAGNVLDLNPAARTLQLEPNRSSVYGHPLEQVFGPILAQELTRSPESLHQTEITLASAIYDLRVRPIDGARGELQGRLLVLRDITRRKQTQAERERLIAELDAFAHTVAHDLKNPLMIIVGYSNILRENLATLSPQAMEESLQQIENTGFRMGRIVESLLLLAESDGSKEVPFAPLDTGMIVQEALARLANLSAAANPRLTIPDDWPEALGYAPWVEEVWVNYLSNAIKYGGTPPEITLGARNLPDGMVQFEIHDNGPGLTPEQQAQLFTRFARLHTDRAEGHGLGLSIIRRIVERMSGTVGVTSTPGTGSTFMFTLPAAPVPEKDIQTPE